MVQNIIILQLLLSFFPNAMMNKSWALFHIGSDIFQISSSFIPESFFFILVKLGHFFFLLIALSQSTFNFSLLLYVALCIFTISKCKVINLYSQMMCKNSDFYAKEKKRMAKPVYSIYLSTSISSPFMKLSA